MTGVTQTIGDINQPLRRRASAPDRKKVKTALEPTKPLKRNDPSKKNNLNSTNPKPVFNLIPTYPEPKNTLRSSHQ